MPVKQLQLFPYNRPLVERFGTEFFKSVPKEPGVYWMRDERERYLYVGQSGCLKTRLGSYRYITPDQHSRKLVRLVCRTRRIDWETCPNSEAALLLENEMLRVHKPRFNTLNVRPEHYAFVGLLTSRRGLHLRLTKSRVAMPGETIYGAFKGIARCRRCFKSLIRLLCFMGGSIERHYDFPARLLRPSPVERFHWDDAEMARQFAPSLSGFLNGGTREFLDACQTLIERRGIQSKFLAHLLEHDLAKLESFFQFGPERNKRLIETYHINEGLIPQNRLDDLLILG